MFIFIQYEKYQNSRTAKVVLTRIRNFAIVDGERALRSAERSTAEPFTFPVSASY